MSGMSAPGCGCISDEYTMKRAPAKWVADNPAAYDNGIRSFWLNAFVSQWATWKSIVLKFLEAIGDTAKMQVVYNTCFGKLWENRGDIQDEDTLLGRREEYEAELPDGVLVLTAGIDTQDDRMEYEIKGHGHFNETWGIEKGIVMGRPDDDATWEQLDNLVFNRYFQFKDGIKLRVSMSFVDEGGHFTQEVRQRCRERIGRKVFCIKGFAGPDRPYTGPPKQVKIVVNGTHVGTCWQYQIGVDAGKQIIMDNLRVGTVGRNTATSRSGMTTASAISTACCRSILCTKRTSASRGNGKKFPATSETRRWTAATMQWRRSRRCRATLTALTGH